MSENLVRKLCELPARARVGIGERSEHDVNGRHPVASELTLTLRSTLCFTEFTSLRVKYVHSPFLGCPLYIVHRASETVFVPDDSTISHPSLNHVTPNLIRAFVLPRRRSFVRVNTTYHAYFIHRRNENRSHDTFADKQTRNCE